MNDSLLLVVLLEGSVLKGRWQRRGVGLAAGSGGGRGRARRAGAAPPEALGCPAEVAALRVAALPVASDASLPLAAGGSEMKEQGGCP